MVAGPASKVVVVVLLDWDRQTNQSAGSIKNSKIPQFEAVVAASVVGSRAAVVVVVAAVDVEESEIGDAFAAEVAWLDVAVVVGSKCVVAAAAVVVVALADAGAVATLSWAGLAPSLRPNGCPERTFH